MYDFECPQCGGEGYFLGVLGDLLHFRCRDCGSDWSESLVPDDDEVRSNVSAGPTTLADW